MWQPSGQPWAVFCSASGTPQARLTPWYEGTTHALPTPTEFAPDTVYNNCSNGSNNTKAGRAAGAEAAAAAATAAAAAAAAAIVVLHLQAGNGLCCCRCCCRCCRGRRRCGRRRCRRERRQKRRPNAFGHARQTAISRKSYLENPSNWASR